VHTPPRRPFGLTVLSLCYIVLGSHALMFGAYLASLTPATAPTLDLAAFAARDPGFVRLYGLGLLGIALPFFANGLALFRGKPWARWTTLLIAPLHIVGPPFLLGGVLFAALANLYVFGAGTAWAFLSRPRAVPLPEA
jgi:hypothetical protein